MKNFITKNYWIFSLLISVVLYLLFSFIRWDIKWLLNAGQWSGFDRGMLVFVLIIKELITLIAYFGIKDNE